MGSRPNLLALYVAVLLVGCVQAKPLTSEDRCVLLCQGNDANHPCHGEQPADGCVTECNEHIAELTDDCLTCVLTQSGWIGEACVCREVDAFGNLNVTCDACSYTTHETKCASSTACTKDTATCQGFILVEPTDAVCTPACGG